LDASSPSVRSATVSTSIGTLNLRLESAADVVDFEKLKQATRGAELWRAHLLNVGSRDAPEGAPPPPLNAADLCRLTDDELDRTAATYLDEVIGAGSDPSNAMHVPEREQGERNCEYLVRLLEARHIELPESSQTTIDRLAPIYTQSFAEAQTKLEEMEALVPDPPLHWAAAKKLAGELKSREDAIADAQKCVEEIQNLLGRREEQWQELHVLRSPVETIGAPAAMPVMTDPGVRVDETPTDTQKPSARAAEDRAPDMTAFHKAAEANHKTAERLGTLAQALNQSVADLEESRQRSDALVRRGIVIAIAVLGAACVLTALGLVQDYSHQRALQTWQESARAQLASQQELQQEIARLRDERASLAARVEQLESERNAKLSEAAKPVEVAKAPEPVKTAEAARPAKSSKSARSSRSARTSAR
jgi:DNA repair exonuclease SbcCD ATPase subunit